MDEKIRVFVADDHNIAIKALIITQPDMQWIGTAGDGAEAVSQVQALQPDVILLGNRQNGIEAIHHIRATNPQARILVLASNKDEEMVFATIKAGALGYLHKDASPAELLQAIRDVYQGKASLHPDVAVKLVQELNRPSELPPTKNSLTEREIEVLKLVARGMTNIDIAGTLMLSERTVRTHISNILGKLHLANRTQAALYALRQGLARLDE